MRGSDQFSKRCRDRGLGMLTSYHYGISTGIRPKDSFSFRLTDTVARGQDDKFDAKTRLQLELVELRLDEVTRRPPSRVWHEKLFNVGDVDLEAGQWTAAGCGVSNHNAQSSTTTPSGKSLGKLYVHRTTWAEMHLTPPGLCSLGPPPRGLRLRVQ